MRQHLGGSIEDHRDNLHMTSAREKQEIYMIGNNN